MSNWLWDVQNLIGTSAKAAGAKNKATFSVTIDSSCSASFRVTLQGNQGSCTGSGALDVTVGTTPTISAPSARTVNADAGHCYASKGGISFGVPVLGDSCPISTAWSSNAPAQFPVGSTLVTWTVTDACGKTATSDQLITVIDNQSPTITCPATVTVNADAAKCYATGVSLGTPSTADNCAVQSVSNNAPSQFPVGNTTVTWTVTDTAGRTATCNQTVTVIDNQSPTITCPATMTVNADAAKCYATGVSLGTPSTADNCAVQSVSNNAPSQFSVGNTTVTWTVTDTAGRTATCSQTVTVIDNQSPTITCPATVTVNADAAKCSRPESASERRRRPIIARCRV